MSAGPRMSCIDENKRPANSTNSWSGISTNAQSKLGSGNETSRAQIENDLTPPSFTYPISVSTDSRLMYYWGQFSYRNLVYSLKLFSRLLVALT